MLVLIQYSQCVLNAILAVSFLQKNCADKGKYGHIFGSKTSSAFKGYNKYEICATKHRRGKIRLYRFESMKSSTFEGSAQFRRS